jgi:heterodisulfide reductase subunit A
LTLSEVTEVSGGEGDFHVKVIQYPRYVDVDKCIACGLCAEKCPKKVDNEYDENLNKRKAIYVKYAQAVPLKYAIDEKHCIYLTKGKCGVCKKVCPAGAIHYEDKQKALDLRVGSIVLAVGGQTFDPQMHDTYGYAKHPNILTSLEFERILSSSGPYGGHLVRPLDRQEPKKIAWLQCIGSRDEHLGAKGYCSGVCCTYAVKEAMLAKEHSKEGLDTAIFYIDMRTYGKDFERYYNRAKSEMGVRFVKSKVTNLAPMDDGRLLLRYVSEAGKRVEEPFDMVVLSVGLEVPGKAVDLAKRLGVELNHYFFAQTSSFAPVESSQPGIYVCGVCQAPKDIPASVVESSAAAGVVGGRLAKARWSLTKKKEIPQEMNVRGEPPRIGVFVCCCGTNIAGTVDVPAVVAFAKGLPFVAYVEQNLFSCSQDTQEKMKQIIKEQRLNRVVVAACTPKTHEPLFQETLTSAGINKYLFEMTNIRNQCSWVHKDDPAAATVKAKDLIRMSVSKVALLEPLPEPKLEINQSALVIGGGMAGMAAARNLAQQGFKTYLVEKTAVLGGNAATLIETWRGEDIQGQLARMVHDVTSDERIQVLRNTEITQVDGYAGNFRTTVKSGRESRMIEHGVTIIACGASELKPEQHLYGRDPRVMTAMELQQRFLDQLPDLEMANTAVFVQCVGSRIPERPYCSKVCCTQSIKSGLKLKEINPGMDVFIVYRDMRAYGLREDLYREARRRGIHFIRYNTEKGLDVRVKEGDLVVAFTDRVLKRPMEIHSDLLILASAVVTEKENPLAQFFKVPQNADGFFAEAHVKLRPVDFATDGVFVCGMAHAPKPIDESITQAQAAAARAVTLLSAKIIPVSGTVAEVNGAHCSQCGTCVSVCPYSAPRYNEKSGKAEIQSTLCKGCGLCVASCRSGAIHLKGFEDSQIMAMIDALS